MTARVLLIDDDDGNRLTLSAVLETEDFEVTQASSVADARQMLTTAPSFDLVLLDRYLHDGLGIGLIPLIRSQLPNGKIIVISGSGNDERESNTAENTDAYFGKGQDLDELLYKIRALLIET
jgi:two-component system response regulator RegA